MKQQGKQQGEAGNKDDFSVNIEAILPLVNKPGRYIGGELGAVHKGWDTVGLHYCLIFPDLYEIGMSHQGLQILYHIVNGDTRFLAERCYAPDIDMEAQLREGKLPLFSIESRRSLADFDVLGFTLPYELCYTNILTVLDLAGVPLKSSDRTLEHPLVIGGGSCALNPEPVADFFDVIVLGDGEEVIVELGEGVLAAKKEGLNKKETLLKLAAIPGLYIPAFFEPLYKDGKFAGVRSLEDNYNRVHRRVLPRLPESNTLAHPLVPIVKPVHDRLGIEIARGCTRGCRFCQAGMIYRPVRERSADDILKIAEQGIADSGFDELALLSLSTGDYSCLPEVLTRLMNRFADEYVSVSMPSMRVGTLTPEIIEQIKRVRKTGFTVAPEAGTDRMREVINKGITEEDLLATCRDAFGAGWNLIKFYFMFGLPTETLDDVDGIVELAKKARAAGGGGGRIQINVSVATFIPKPHTPFQWHQQLTIEESKARLNRLKQILPRKGFKLKWHDAHTSYMEGVFSRGDRKLCGLIETAWKNGVRLDGWSEHFRLKNWEQAAESCGIDMDSYLRGRTMEEPLPWDHLHPGVDREFLEKEWYNALTRAYTTDCRNQGCQKCGLCDFKTIKPVVNTECSALPVEAAVNKSKAQEETVFRHRVHYTRLGDSRFYGHLELLQLVFRVLHRAGLPVLFSKGYNPSPKVSFSQALPVGVESLVEHFDVELSRPLNTLPETIDLLNKEFPETIRVTSIALIGKGRQADQEVSYHITLPAGVEVDIADKITAFLDAKEYIIERIRKRKRKQLDIRPLVQSLEQQGEQVEVTLVQRHSQAGISPVLLLEKVLGLSTDQARIARVMKTAVHALE